MTERRAPTARLTGTARLTRKRVVLPLLLVAAGLLALAGARTWVRGGVDDALLGVSTVRASGSQVAPASVAAALVGAAAAVAAATATTRFVRVVSGLAAVLAGLLAAALVVGVLADPATALGRVAATNTGRTGVLQSAGRAGPWAWVALAAALTMVLGAAGILVGGGRWAGLSSRYDAPLTSGDTDGSAGSVLPKAAEGAEPPTAGASERPASGDAAGPRAAAADSRGMAELRAAAATRRRRGPASDWDRLSVGDDPTADVVAPVPSSAPEGADTRAGRDEGLGRDGGVGRDEGAGHDGRQDAPKSGEPRSAHPRER